MSVTIQDSLTVRELSQEDILEYFSSVLGVDYSSPTNSISTMISELQCSINGHRFTLCPRIAAEYFLAYISERYYEINWSIIQKGVIFTNCYVLKFYHLGNVHYLFLDDVDYSYVIEHLTLFDSGMMDNAPILALLEEELSRLPLEDRFVMYEYLTMLGIREPVGEIEIEADYGSPTTSISTREPVSGIKIEAEEPPIIPANSDTILMDETMARFSSAMWFEEIQKKTIVLAGIGGIGSYVGFLLSRMKPKALFIYDDDRVETVNMSGQLYGSFDVGLNKVEALRKFMSSYSGYEGVFAIPNKFTDECEACDIMICGFDNMSVRKVYYNKWLSHVTSKSPEERKHCLFIDGRLSAEELQVLCIRGDDTYNLKRYSDNFLFSDEEADATVCSYKQTSYMANMIGSIIVNLFTNFVANEVTEGIRDLPFFTSYDGESMMFKVEN